ncbi:HAMP domain-containing sensor histidine kinase [Rhodanobacter sp. DHB23]|uniref:HAMP domain-containing sensor histidine kinase n=1 Tax=Rhodanobacter sp. DHB23 TaxID=2775923 RepID=UPI001786DB19|nr:HAMP domain-containing sensor histidine kinase [Rhodanobacter sp. DHB23]MBD8871859.1 HAMP domain-containing histidine kinase [Rhodanobacter sp. DHB23]
MNPFKSSLYWRLLLWFCAVNLLVLVLGGFLTRRFVEYTTAVEIDWAALAQSAEQAYDQGGPAGLADWSSQQRHEGVEATLFQDGQPLRPVWLPPSILASLPGMLATNRSLVLRPWRGLLMYVAVEPVVGADGRQRQLVAISRTRTRLPPQARERILLAVQCALSLLFIGLVGWWVARSVAKPVQALRAAAQRMAAGELSARVDHPGGAAHDELAQLAGDFDAMAERIEALVTHDRRVLQDLSHELRSPLARLQLIIDLAQRSADPVAAERYFRQAEQEIARLDRMTGDMLALSRMEGGLPGMERERLDFAELAHDGVRQAALEADARRIDLQWRHAAGGPIDVVGTPVLLERALGNLISNAIKYSPEGSRVEVSVQAAGGQAECLVRDQGPGVPEAELGSLFRPFFRGSNAARAEGHGLGLAIAQRVARAHGGEILARNAGDGGLEVRLRLPVAAS